MRNDIELRGNMSKCQLQHGTWAEGVGPVHRYVVVVALRVSRQAGEAAGDSIGLPGRGVTGKNTVFRADLFVAPDGNLILANDSGSRVPAVEVGVASVERARRNLVARRSRCLNPAGICRQRSPGPIAHKGLAVESRGAVHVWHRTVRIE